MGAGEREDRKGGVAAAPLVELVHLAKGARSSLQRCSLSRVTKLQATPGQGGRGAEKLPIVAT